MRENEKNNHNLYSVARIIVSKDQKDRSNTGMILDGK